MIKKASPHATKKQKGQEELWSLNHSKSTSKTRKKLLKRVEKFVARVERQKKGREGEEVKRETLLSQRSENQFRLSLQKRGG